ncbi:MAG: HlyD family efflux transporter periplasmic adaptor subunit [Deltaproteobacteria bacterium]|nr:HlyD family efflux transporter periplasmic adaptor subunit [Deltaproteobacteria bacterium]
MYTTNIRFGKVIPRPNDNVMVVAPVQSRLADIKVSYGQSVTAGDVLAALQPAVNAVAQADMTTRLAGINAQITAGRSRIRAAGVELDRISKLLESGLATLAQREQAKAELESEKALISGLERSAHVLRGYAGGHIVLTAPVSGNIVEIKARIGALLKQGQVVAQIVTPGPRFIDLGVPPDDPTGDAYLVETAGRHFTGELLARGSFIVNGMRTDRIRIRTGDMPSLSPGRIVPVQVRHELSGIVVPLMSVVRLHMDRIVFIEIHPGLYKPQKVVLSGNNGSLAVVSRGVAPGEHVVVQGAASLLGEIGFSGRLGDLDKRNKIKTGNRASGK